MTADEEKLAEDWYAHKSKLMEQFLGKEHEMVMHAIIPYAIGGALDLYYFPNGISGTGIATKELSELPNEGSKNDQFSCYELVMFTKEPLDLDRALDETTRFGRVHSTINAILNVVAPYSAEATLNPCETCEFPPEMEDIGGECLIFDCYGAHTDDWVANFGLLLAIRIFRTEMNFAREHGGSELLARLRERGHYPYSDLDREPVA